jgi:hypothetical protein
MANIHADLWSNLLVHMYLFMDPRLVELLNKSIRPKVDQRDH